MTGRLSPIYRVLSKLGEGGMGIVYKAEDTKLRRTVALKFLPPQAAEHGERFLREAQAAASLNHPNICTIHEIDEEHGFIAMEFIDGPSVKEKIDARPLPLEEALDIVIQAGKGLQAAHEKGIVHRDIKPANLMLTPQGQVKIMDFGLAQVGNRTRITKPGASVGTPAICRRNKLRANPPTAAPTSGRSVSHSPRCSPAGGPLTARTNRGSVTESCIILPSLSPLYAVGFPSNWTASGQGSRQVSGTVLSERLAGSAD